MKTKGVTFIELIISLFILIICIVYVNSVFVKGMAFYSKVKAIYPAYNACASKTEEILAVDSISSIPAAGIIENTGKEYEYTLSFSDNFDGNPKLCKITMETNGPLKGRYQTKIKLTILKAVK